MNYLADVNVLVALALAGHVHQAIARQWSEEPETGQILFCRTSQKGLLRLLTNPRVMGPNVLAAKQAWDLYDAFYQDQRVMFAAEAPELEAAWRESTRGRTPELLDRRLPGSLRRHRGFRRHRGVPVRLLAANA